METMDNFFDPVLAWSVYLISALIGCWCWRAMFFWLKKPGFVRDFLVMLGPVLLLTPTPLEPGRSEMAPAFLAAGLAALGGETELLTNTLMWWLAGLLIGVLYVLVRMIVRMQMRKSAEPEAVDYAAE